MARKPPKAAVEFVSLVSHELKTPLTSILGSVELLNLAREKLDEEQRTLIEVILRGCRRLQRMIDELLMLSRIEAGRLALVPEEVDLGALAREVAGGLDGRRIELRLEPGAPPLRGDRSGLRQVVEHLLRNALQYSPPESPVTLELARKGGRLEVAVRDRGMGLTRAERAKLFRKFYRSEGARRSGVDGAGLGLAISKYLVELHRGRIRVESEPGKGATFTVSLPIGKPHG